jgi:hypothetical protein
MKRWVQAAGLSAAVLALGGHGGRPAAAQARIGQDVADSPAVWRAFQPLVKAFGQGDPKRAVSYLQESSRIVRKADAQLERDATTETFRTKAIASLEDFDLARFLGLLPEPSGLFRRFAFQGAPAERTYRVTATTGSASDVHAQGKRRDFGDSSGAVRMRKLSAESDRHYAMEVRGGVGIGAVPFDAVKDGLSDALSLLERAPLGKDEPLVLRAADSYLQKTQASLSPQDRAILASAWSSFPELAKLLVLLGRTEDVIDDARSVEGATRVRLASRWDVAGMRKLYPDLAAYFEGLGDLAEYTTTLTDAAGNVLLTARLNTAKVQSSLEAYVHDGRLVPSRDGKPLVGVLPQYGRMTARTNMHLALHRVHLYLDDYRTDLTFRDDGAVAELSLSARSVPKVRVAGAAFGVLPTAMLDWFIPGDIESLTKRLFETASKGNGGRGSVATARLATSADGRTTVDGELGFEVLDSALIRFAMAIVADKVVPDADQEEDMRRLAVAYRDAFDADLARFARFGR